MAQEKTISVTVEIPAHTYFSTQSAGDFCFDWTRIKADRLAQFVADAAEAGVSKTGVDAASSAKTFAEKTDGVADTDEARKILIGKWIASRYESQEFGARANAANISGEGSAVDAEYIIHFGEKIRDVIGKKEWAKLSATEKRQKALDYIAEQSPDVIKALLPVMKVNAEEREETRKLNAEREARRAERLKAAGVDIKL